VSLGYDEEEGIVIAFDDFANPEKEEVTDAQ
jgi:hypothetical protein